MFTYLSIVQQANSAMIINSLSHERSTVLVSTLTLYLIFAWLCACTLVTSPWVELARITTNSVSNLSPENPLQSLLRFSRTVQQSIMRKAERFKLLYSNGSTPWEKWGSPECLGTPVFVPHLPGAQWPRQPVSRTPHMPSQTPPLYATRSRLPSVHPSRLHTTTTIKHRV